MKFTNRTFGMFTAIVATAAALAFMSGCSKDEVSFQTLETARKQARENGDYNARKWRSETKVYANAILISRGDSSQTSACPQGDGWVSIDIANPDNGATLGKLKCSTVSDSVGCRLDADFKSSPYANEDGSCAPLNRVPHPLPKIGG